MAVNVKENNGSIWKVTHIYHQHKVPELSYFLSSFIKKITDNLPSMNCYLGGVCVSRDPRGHVVRRLLCKCQLGPRLVARLSP